MVGAAAAHAGTVLSAGSGQFRAAVDAEETTDSTAAGVLVLS